MSKKMKLVLIVLCVLLGCLVLRRPILSGISHAVIAYEDWRYALPETGEYFCEDLEMTLSFSEDGWFLQSPGESTQFGGMHNTAILTNVEPGNSFRATFFWNRTDDSISLTFLKLDGEELDRQEKHTFVRAD